MSNPPPPPPPTATTTTTEKKPRGPSIADQLKFEAVSLEGVTFEERPKVVFKRDSVYAQAVQAALLLSVGKAVRTPVPQGVSAKKIEQALKQAIKKASAAGKLEVKHAAGGVYLVRKAEAS